VVGILQHQPNQPAGATPESEVLVVNSAFKATTSLLVNAVTIDGRDKIMRIDRFVNPKCVTASAIPADAVDRNLLLCGREVLTLRPEGST